MPDEAWYTRVESKIDRILTELDAPPDPGPDPGVLLAPTGFTTTLNNNDRTITCAWSPQAAAVEVHEFLTDPANTLKAALPSGVNSRTSGALAGGHNYSYAVRSAREGLVSVFTDRVTLYVPAAGEAPPDEEPDPGEEEPPPTGGTHPLDVLDLRNWTIMQPTGSQGDPDNAYCTRTNHCGLFVRGGGVVFRCPADGFHSPNSKYARREARQMRDASWTKAAWSSSGDHSLECDLAIDSSHLTGQRPRINAMQIHDGGDDVCQLMHHESGALGLMHDDGDSFEVIDPHYVNGTRFTCKIHAVNNRIIVTYNGVQALSIPKTGSGWYWKKGCYLNTGGASEFTQPPGAYGEVIVYRYTLTGGGS